MKIMGKRAKRGDEKLTAYEEVHSPSESCLTIEETDLTQVLQILTDYVDFEGLDVEEISQLLAIVAMSMNSETDFENIDIAGLVQKLEKFENDTNEGVRN